MKRAISPVRKNAVANLLGTGWAAILNLAFVPVYVRLLGIESYGLIGLFAALQAALSLLDLGITPALSRELARFSAKPGSSKDANDLARTLEVVYWGVAIAIALIMMAGARIVGTRWVHATSLSQSVVTRSMALMGLVAAAQWPTTFYLSGLQGLQRQVLLNGLSIITATMRYAGAAFVIVYVSRTVEAFFSWQLAVSLLGSTALFAAFWHAMPASPQRPAIRWALLRSIRRFAVGLSGITAISLILTHADKIVLSRLAPLSELGYYSLAAVVAQSLVLISGPVVRSVFPRFAQLAVLDSDFNLRRLYHRACQVIAVQVFPAGLLLSVFASEILTLWTRNQQTVVHTHVLVSLLVIGSIFVAIQTGPYFLALAHGWTGLNLRIGVLTVSLSIPLLVIMVQLYGGVGAATVWVLVNVVTTPFYLYFLHRRILIGELSTWWFDDFLKPLLAAAIPIVVARLVINWLATPNATTPLLAASYVVSTTCAAFASNEVRLLLDASTKRFRAALAKSRSSTANTNQQ
jgi:Membrane protein involved in the export of O-antigen and teichoic acid